MRKLIVILVCLLLLVTCKKAEIIQPKKDSIRKPHFKEIEKQDLWCGGDSINYG